jgi:hypothetical protein
MSSNDLSTQTTNSRPVGPSILIDANAASLAKKESWLTSKNSSNRTLYLQAHSVGKRIPIRSAANPKADVVRYLDNMDKIVVMERTVSGYYQLKDGSVMPPPSA